MSNAGTGTASGNLFGIQISNSSGDTIGGVTALARNIISGNTQSGMLIQNSNGLVIQGNYIGPDVTGTTSAGNGFNGILLSGGSGNTIGGNAAGARNVISGNGRANLAGSNFGIEITEPTNAASNNQIQGNTIGLDSTGLTALGNLGSGVEITGLSSGVTIGGTATGTGNVISGNGADGITLQGTILNSVTNTTIQGNTIGLNISGNAAVGNLGNGITIHDATLYTIGSSSTQGRNVISGNSTAGTNTARESCSRPTLRFPWARAWPEARSSETSSGPTRQARWRSATNTAFPSRSARRTSS